MFGRLGGWEILVIVILVVILFGHNKIPGMMKNLADGINVFKKELKNKSGKKSDKSEKKSDDAPGEKAAGNAGAKRAVKKTGAKNVKKKSPAKK